MIKFNSVKDKDPCKWIEVLRKITLQYRLLCSYAADPTHRKCVLLPSTHFLAWMDIQGQSCTPPSTRV